MEWTSPMTPSPTAEDREKAEEIVLKFSRMDYPDSLDNLTRMVSFALATTRQAAEEGQRERMMPAVRMFDQLFRHKLNWIPDKDVYEWHLAISKSMYIDIEDKIASAIRTSGKGE